MSGANLPRHAAIGYSLFASGDACRAAALAGQGILLQPSFMVGADPAEGRLVELMPGWRAITLGIHAVYPSRKFLAPKLRGIIDSWSRRLRIRPGANDRIVPTSGTVLFIQGYLPSPHTTIR